MKNLRNIQLTIFVLLFLFSSAIAVQGWRIGTSDSESKELPAIESMSIQLPLAAMMANFPAQEETILSTNDEAEVLEYIEKDDNQAVLDTNPIRGSMLADRNSTVRVPDVNTPVQNPGNTALSPTGPPTTEVKPVPVQPVPDVNPPNVELPREEPLKVEPPVPVASELDTDLNSYVLDVTKTYTQGPYPYLLNTDYNNYNGVTENIFFQGKILAKAHPSGNKASHCSGITFEIFYKAMQARNRKLGIATEDFNNMNFNDLHNFLLLWYAASGPKSSSNIAVAVEKYGIGKRITRFEDARAGDFIDISRTNNTGHTAVFLNWVRDGNGNITGVRYWSSQGSTNGIRENTERFTTGGGNVLTSPVYIARIHSVQDYKPFK